MTGQVPLVKGRKSVATPAESKDEDKSGEPFEAGCGFNPESEWVAHKKSCKQDKEKVCGEDIAVVNVKHKEANVEQGCGVNSTSDNLPQRICSEQDNEMGCGENMAVDIGKNTEANIEAASGEMELDSVGNMNDDMGEDEDDEPEYDYSHWHDYVRTNCVTDDEDDFEEGPRKGGSGGQFGITSNRRSGASGGRGQGSGKPPASRGQRSSAAGGSKSTKNPSKRRRSEENTDVGSDNISSSRTVGCSYTEGKETDGGVDVVLVTPPKLKNQHKRVMKMMMILLILLSLSPSRPKIRVEKH
ncbi:hypothetical protein Bca4012_058329 [Brassica carinata]